MSLLSQVAERDPEVLAIGLAIRDHFESRISRAIARWQAEGLAYSDLDPVYTANALAYMVDRFLAEWAALGPALRGGQGRRHTLSAPCGSARSVWPTAPAAPPDATPRLTRLSRLAPDAPGAVAGHGRTCELLYQTDRMCRSGTRVGGTP